MSTDEPLPHERTRLLPPPEGLRDYTGFTYVGGVSEMRVEGYLGTRRRGRTKRGKGAHRGVDRYWAVRCLICATGTVIRESRLRSNPPRGTCAVCHAEANPVHE